MIRRYYLNPIITLLSWTHHVHSFQTVVASFPFRHSHKSPPPQERSSTVLYDFRSGLDGGADPEGESSSTSSPSSFVAPLTFSHGSARPTAVAERNTNADNNENNNNNKKDNKNNNKSNNHQNDLEKTKYKAHFVAETNLPTDLGQFRMRGYRVTPDHGVLEPVVIYAADKPPQGQEAPVVRIHDQCLTSEVFGSLRCDCSEQLHMALQYIQEHGGAIIYLQQEGRGIGLANKIAAYALQDIGFDTVDANVHLGFAEDCREYDVVQTILEEMRIESIQLMTNNPKKVDLLTNLGINVLNTVPLVVGDTTEHNHNYLETKKKRMSHANLTPLLARRKNNNDAAATPPISNGVMMMAPLTPPPFSPPKLSPLQNVNGEAQGVTASSDGYCFGRQSVEDAIAAISRGEIVVVVDDMDRENEGDLIMAADMCTGLDMATIVKYSSGVICIALEEERLQELELPSMVSDNQDPKGTAFTVSVDATKEHGITTGISAFDRAATVQLLAHPESRPTDFHRPGHIFPLRARKGGVLTRDGHTEAAVDLAKLAGRSPAGVLCEIVSEENPIEMMRLPEIKRFCQKEGYVLTSIADLQQYRRDTEDGEQGAL